MTLSNQYSIIGKCGSGALSDVFEAVDCNGDKVAIKSLKVFFKEESFIKERLTKEALILKELRDEKIVKYKDFFFNESGAPSLVVEFVDGKDLSFYIKNLGSQKIPFIGSQLISEVLLGLEEVHRFGFIHRDLKPENIMLTKDGRIKITDFGLARNLESHDLTLSGTILGSPIFMSPEQCRGDEVDQRSDIFSIGVLLYYFATMLYPFKGESYPMIAKAITQTEPIAPMQANPYVDKLLNKIILKALAKNPNERYQKVYEMRNDLMFFLDEFKISHHSKVFKEFISNNLSEEQAYQQKLVDKYTILYQLSKKENKSQSHFYLNQLIKIDPSSEAVQKLSQQGIKSSKSNYSGMMKAAVCLFFCLIGLYWWKQSTNVELLRSNIVRNEMASSGFVLKTSIPVATKTPIIPAIKSVTQKPLPKKIEPETIVELPKIKPKESITGIQFILPSDTRAYVDDVEVDSKEIYKVNPGKHRLKMIRNNFTPIESEVDVLSDKITKINVGS